MSQSSSDRLRATFQLSYAAFTLDISLDLPAQGTTAVFGPSGCGKTSLLRCLAGLERPADATVVFKNTTWQNEARGVFVPPSKRSIGLVFQESRLFPHFTVRKNLTYGFSRTPSSQRRITLDQIIDLLQLAPLLNRRPHTLSGGEQQRVAIGRALLTSPRLLLMDEPLSSLDYARKQEILPFLKAMNRELGIPLVYVTHAVEEVLQLADRLVVLKEGTVRAEGRIQDVFSELDMRTILPEHHLGAVIDTSVGAQDDAYGLTRLDFAGRSLQTPQLARPVGDQVRVQILAKDVSIVIGERPFHTSVLNVLPATVLEIGAVTPTLPFVDVKLDIGCPLLARITRKSLMALGLKPGDRVYAQIKAVAFSPDHNL